MILINLFGFKKFNSIKKAKGYMKARCTQHNLQGSQLRTSEKYNENAVAVIGISHIIKLTLGKTISSN